MNHNAMPMYTLPEVEADIHQTYKWFHENAPGVWPQEEGQLGALWALFDLLIEEENDGKD